MTLESMRKGGHFATTLSWDLVNMLCDEMIGEGISRCVYPWSLDRSLVAKVEPGHGGFANAQEWDVWQRIKDTEHAKWFAPCVHISGCGIWLLQKRTKPIPFKRLPKQVPAFFTDLKQSNWGLLNGRPVCHDYAANLLMEVGMTKRLRSPNWGV